MIDEMKMTRQTEKLLYSLTIILAIINCLGLIGKANVENTFLVLLITIVLLITGVNGLIKMQAEKPIEQVHDRIYNSLYMDISMGFSGVLILLSPRLLSFGTLVPSVIASIGCIVLGLYCLYRERKIVDKWI